MSTPTSRPTRSEKLQVSSADRRKSWRTDNEANVKSQQMWEGTQEKCFTSINSEFNDFTLTSLIF